MPRPGILPAAGDIPGGFATVGTWYDFFAGKAAAKFGVEWGPGFATFQYPNNQRESTLWYHDHTLGMTRLNVYAGPAGFFLVRGGPEGDKAVLDSRTGTSAVLPSPAPNEGDTFPPKKTYYEIPIAVQDRSFNADGSLFYPDTRTFFDGIVRDYIPDGEFSPIWNPEFFGNMIMVNGNTWPFQSRRAAPLPPAIPQRLPVALPDPGLRQHPRRRGLADRQRGRLPGRPGEPDRDQRQPAAHGPGRAGRPDRRLHQRADRQLRPRQPRPRRALRRRGSGRRLPGRGPSDHRPGDGVPGRARGSARPHDAAAVPGAPRPHPAHRWHGPTAGADREVGRGLRRGRQRGRRPDRGTPRHGG